MFDRYRGHNFRAFFVVTADEQYAPATAPYCVSKQAQFDLSMPVLINPAGDLAASLGTASNDVDVVTACGQIMLRGDYQRLDDVKNAIDDALGL